MHKLGFFCMNILVPAFVGAALIASPATAQDKAMAGKKVAIKVLLENNKVKVQDVRYTPGAEGENSARPPRVVRVVKGGTLALIFPDGKSEKLLFKTGEVVFRDASPVYMPKNVGKSDIVLFVVLLK